MAGTNERTRANHFGFNFVNVALLNLNFSAICGSRARLKRRNMSGCVRQRLGPTKTQLVERIQEAQSFLQQDNKQDEYEDKANQLLLKLERNLNSYKNLLVQLQEASKKDEVKRQRLENEMEEFTILALDGDETICDLEMLLKKITQRKQGNKENEANQRERYHQKMLQMEKLTQEKEIQMERFKLELEMMRQKEKDKQHEFEL